ncbi:MAG: TIGR01777 family oxidoreductase [Gemmatimonas sp.]
MIHTFRRTLRVPYPVETLFAWHERPGAFTRLSPPWDKIVVLEHTGGIRDGARVVLEVHTGPLPTKWTLQHRDYIANRQFRDVMLNGPFDFWTHTHAFASAADGSTLEDHIEYALPLGGVGNLVAGDYAESTLARVFAYRHEVTTADLARHAEFAPRPRMRIAITGASGFIGTALAAFLSTGGHDVLRIGRGPVSPGKTDISWDPERGKLDAKSLDGVDAVIHLAGASIAERWTPEHRRAIRESRVEGTSLLAHTLASLSRKPRVLLSGSAIGYYGVRGDEILDETSRAGTDYLAETAKQWEAATGPPELAGIRVVHLRTGIVQGAAGGALGKLATLFKLGMGGKLGDGNQWTSPIALDDEIGAIHFCMMRDDIRGPVNITTPYPIQNAGYTRVLGDVVDRPTFTPAPAFAIRMLLGTEMANLTALASQRVMPTVLQKAGFRWRFQELESMLRFELGLERPMLK